MTTEKALEELDSMAAQFIGHEKTNIMAQLAEVIRKQESVRLAALKAVGAAIDRMAIQLPPDDDTFLAHRILANGEPDGTFKGDVINSANASLSHGDESAR